MAHPRDLLTAVQKGNAAQVDRLLEAEVSPSARVLGTTPLIVAASEKRAAIALRLVAAGADVDAVDDRGDTALYWATNRQLPELAQAIAAAPGEPLARARRVLDAADRDAATEPRPCIQAAKAFVDAAVEGRDIGPHLPRLYSCHRYFPHSWDITRLSLERAICLHVVRGGDPAALARLAGELRSGEGVYRGDLALALGLAFADTQGGELRPLYPLLVEHIGDHPSLLSNHLQVHPERLQELARMVVARDPGQLPRLLTLFSQGSWDADASPAAGALARFLRSEDGQVRGAAAGALQALTRRRQLDLTSIAAELGSLVSERRQVELASELLVRWAMGQRPPDWETVDHFCLHPIEEARKGALRAMSWDWTQGEGTSGTTTRLASALMDETTAVRQQAHSALAEGRRLQKPFLSVEPDVLEALAGVLGTEPGANVAEFLLEYARSTPQHAGELLPVLQAASSANRMAAGLAATCQQIAGGTHVGPCTICRYLGQEAGWGEEMVSGGLASTPPPPAFARLERLNEKQYRCPECGAYFALHEGGGSFMNAEWTNWTLTRAAGPETLTPSLQTHELIRRGDLGGLDRTLLRSPDPAVQMEALETVETQVREGLDIAVLEPTLRELLTGAVEVAQAAARALTRYLLRQGQPGAVEALLRGGGSHVQLGALNAIDRAALESPAEVGAYLGMVRRFFESEEETLRSCALAIVLKAGLEPGVAEATAADAIQRLESPRSGERALAASILSEAARQRRADIRPALPRLAALWRNETGIRSAQYAAERAIKHAGGELEHLGGITGLVERLTFRGSGADEVSTLRQMLERGEDISPAFEALATMAGSWPLELLKRAAFQGDDLSPAVAPLRLLTRKADQDPANITAACEARAAVGILACHYFLRRSWADLTAILGSDQEYVRAGLREAVGEMAGLVWGKHPAEGTRRRGAAAAMAYLALGTDRSDLVSLAFDLELPEDVMGGVVEGLAAAARSGMNVERFLGRLRKLRNQPLVAEMVAAVKPEPLRPVERTEWHSGRDHCQVTGTEVVCWSGEGHGEVGAACSLKAFLDGEQQELVQSLLGGAVLREVLNAVRSQVASAPKAPRPRTAPASSRPRRKRP